MAKTLAEKFFIKPNQRILAVQAPMEYLSEILTDLPEGAISTEESHGTFDQIHYFVTSEATLTSELPLVKTALTADGIIWVCYPKGINKAKIPTDLNRDKLALLLTKFGLEPIHQMAIDETWSALRFKRTPLGQTRFVE